MTALMLSVQRQHLPIVQYLLEKGAHVNVCTVAQRTTPLMLAIRCSFPEGAYCLIAAGADLHETNR